MKRSLIAAALAVALAAPAAAHTAYLKPDRFWANNGVVNTQGAFTTTFFTPEIGLSSNFEIIAPDGTAGFFSQAEVTAQAARLQSQLYQYGTYRITSGEQLGAVSQLVGIDGAWRPAVAGEVLPEGAVTTTLQTVTLAETYVTRGTPSNGVLERVIGRLALKPVTHPNQILINAPFQVQVLFDGAPLANTALVIYAAGEPETDIDRYAATDASGVATITLDQPGAYMLAARHRADAAPGSQAQVQSFTTTLTFEALSEMPAFVAPPEEERRGRRRRN
jgi:uncharacterized GH25 family protein